MIHVGVVGTGFGRTVHIPAFQRLDGVEVLGVASHDPQRARSVAAECRVPRTFDCWQDLVASPDIDVVAIATPPATHARIALETVAAGKSVLCEKPLALDAVEAWAMRDAAVAAQVVHFIGFEFREIRAFEVARQRLHAGAVGEVRHVDVRWMVDSWTNRARPWSWRADVQQGGGTLGALGVHAFDYIEWLLGPVRAVLARLDTRITERSDAGGRPRAVTAEDYCDILLELHDGTPVNVLLSMVASQGRAHSIEVHGSRAVLTLSNEGSAQYASGFGVWEGQPGTTTRQIVPGSAEAPVEAEDGRIAPFLRLARRFIEAVKGRELGIGPSFEDGARAQVLVDAVRRASRERRWIEVAGAGVIV